jgi:hypothetical protein
LREIPHEHHDVTSHHHRKENAGATAPNIGTSQHLRSHEFGTRKKHEKSDANQDNFRKIEPVSNSDRPLRAVTHGKILPLNRDFARRLFHVG